jgi:HAD superfamily hydrolase (TIGR01549 family)
MIRAVIFDCFGVLTTEAWLAFKAQHFGHDPSLMQRVTEISHQADRGLISLDDAVQQTAELAGISADEFRRANGGNVPNQELFDYLKLLKPKYKLGLLSNISDDYLQQIFKPEQLSLFDGIELSYKTGVIKPQPGAYENAANRLGFTVEECVMVDDQERNVTGAREAGMKAVLYENFVQFKTELEKLLAADTKN